VTYFGGTIEVSSYWTRIPPNNRKVLSISRTILSISMNRSTRKIKAAYHKALEIRSIKTWSKR